MHMMHTFFFDATQSQLASLTRLPQYLLGGSAVALFLSTNVCVSLSVVYDDAVVS